MKKSMKNLDEMEYILVTDVGSTTTKARLFKKNKDGWRFLIAGEAPTTVEEPYEDVTLGVRNAVREIEEHTNHNILSEEDGNIIVPYNGERGVDLYCTTSSAGGGLQMIVAGFVKSMTAESANRASLGAGAIVMDVLAVDDGRQLHQKIQRIRNLRPDMLMISGGIDGGADIGVIEIAELISSAEPKSRLGTQYKLPIIYAGNSVIKSQIRNVLDDKFALTIVDNLRPTLEKENTEPARRAVHDLFMEHVMSQAPGYTKLMKWSEIDIMPTPAGEGIAMQLISNIFNMNVLGVGLGGATTNVYSIFDNRFVRSVSANLGMSYSITNVMKEAGIKNILRWMPFEMSEKDLGNRLMNKMIRPTTIPHTLEDLIIEHSVAREALRLGLKHHKTIATRLKGIRIVRDISNIFDDLDETYIKMSDIDVIAGTGGLLSHAPNKVQSLLILTDAWQPEGVTRVFQDSVFMMPHLGLLSTVYRDAALNIFDKDCLVRLGTVISPSGIGNIGEPVMTVELRMPGGNTIKENLNFGEIKRINLPERIDANAVIIPKRDFDVGGGSGHKFESVVMGGVAGIILDARGRPINLFENEDERRIQLLDWFKSLAIYPRFIEKYTRGG